MDTKEKTLFGRYMDWMEKVGNRLPDPMMMFVWLTVFIMVLSFVLDLTGCSAVNPATGQTIQVRNLISRFGAAYFFTNTVHNFANFAPLAYVLIALVGATVAEKSGFLASAFQKAIPKRHGWMVTAIIIFVSLNSSAAGDAAVVILPPLAAIMYMSIGRRPVLGCYISFGSVSAGFSSSCLLDSLDSTLASISQDAARIIDPECVVLPACNYYFLVASTFLLTIGGTLMVEKILLKRFLADEQQKIKYKNYLAEITVANDTEATRKACIGIVAVILLIIAACIPWGGKPALLANADGQLMASGTPFNEGLVLFITVLLLVPGIIYGVGVGKYKKAGDLRADIEKGFADMGGYVFICFVISIFVNLFAQSNIGAVFSIKGAEWLKSIGFDGIPLIICMVILCAFINLFMGSASAKWAILAQVFIPMMMLLGYDPAVTQIVYRIGDSITNPVSPLFVYIPILLGTLNKIYPDYGIGTIIANMIPISLTFALIWIAQLVAWILLGLPFGPSV